MVEGRVDGRLRRLRGGRREFRKQRATSPGALVTLFGSRMGPLQGVNFQLENGIVPTELAGTRVLVNGAPVPILYSSYWQVNVVLPYSLAVR